MQLVPSYSTLKAVGNTNIELVSLGIEGAEFDVMGSIFQTIKFRVSVGPM